MIDYKDRRKGAEWPFYLILYYNFVHLKYVEGSVAPTLPIEDVPGVSDT